jgi:hypothetical protein
MRLTSIALLLVALAGCSPKSGALTPDLTRRFESEGIVRQADDQVFRYTEGGGKRGGMWDEGRASIVVTKATVFLHRGARVMVEITTTNGADYSVHRDHDRVAIHTGTGRSAKVWSFRPTDDAEAWAKDMRAVVKGVATE